MKKILFFLLIVNFANAKVLEVKQLFNKKIVEVQKKELSITKTFYATTKLDESKIYDITLRFSGYIQNLYANKNYMKIKKGDKLFSIYSDKISNLKEELRVAKKTNQSYIINSLKKKLKLLDINSLINDDYTVDITSKYDGYIIQKSINQGSFLKSGKSAFKIADFRTMWVIAKGYQKDLDSIKVGDNAEVYIKDVGKFNSKVDFIYPNIDTKTKTFDIRLILQNPKNQIFPNLFAKVAINTNSKTILTLPKSAVLTKGAKHFVFLPLKDGEFEPKEIKAKRVNKDRFQILSGLKEGDKVIDNALFLLDSDALTNGLYEDDDDEDW